ncbi:uncharacterized protein LOC144130308 isoform X2 [Amblyomma americanum]
MRPWQLLWRQDNYTNLPSEGLRTTCHCSHAVLPEPRMGPAQKSAILRGGTAGLRWSACPIGQTDVVQVFDSQVTAKAVAQPRPPNECPLLVPRVGSHHVDHSREG